MTDLDQLREIQRECCEMHKMAGRLIRLHTARDRYDMADPRMAPVFKKVSIKQQEAGGCMFTEYVSLVKKGDYIYDDNPLIRLFLVIICALWLVLICVSVCDG